MAENDASNYAAKFVEFRQRDFQAGRVPAAIPSPSRWFYENRREIERHITSLEVMVNAILDGIADVENEYINGGELPVPVVIKMKEHGLAKSHRPDTVFQSVGTHVIAVHGLGRLIVPTNTNVLRNTIDLLEEVKDDIPNSRIEWIVNRPAAQGGSREDVIPEKRKQFELIHELTAIDEIVRYTPSDVLCNMQQKEYADAEEDGKIKVRFFKFDDESLDDLVLNSFIQQFSNQGISNNNMIRYTATELNTYIVPYSNREVIDKLASFPGIETISSFMRFTANYHDHMADATTISPKIPDSDMIYPRVAIVDSGISNDNTHLQPWVEDVVTKRAVKPRALALGI